MNKYTVSVLIENKFGSFNRVGSMFTGRGFNIHSISIGETEVPDVARMTFVTSGDEKVIDQIIKQLNRLIDTIQVENLTELPTVERELLLITISYHKENRSDITNICNIFQGKVVDITNTTIMLEITGPPDKTEAAINVLSHFGIKEVARSGKVALKRGRQERKPIQEETALQLQAAIQYQNV